MIAYKGLTRTGGTIRDYLRPFDDGAPTSPGTEPGLMTL